VTGNYGKFLRRSICGQIQFKVHHFNCREDATGIRKDKRDELEGYCLNLGKQSK
jgi:hypothetical protein